MKKSSMCVVVLLLGVSLSLFAKQSMIVITNLEKMVAIKAVDDVKIAKGLDRLGRTFLPTLESQLQASRHYQLVDRHSFTDLLKEVDFNDSGLVGEPLAKKFKIQGANLMMLVEYLDVEYVSNKRSFELTGTTEETVSLNASVAVKILNTSTAIIEQSLPTVEVSLLQVNSQVLAGEDVPSHSIWTKAGRELAAKVAKSLSSVGSPAKVLAVNGKQVLVNKGEIGGFTKGMNVKFYAMEKVVDDDSGDVFVNEVPVGFGKVVRGDSRKCFIEVAEDLGISKGCIVRGE
jgi:hypothetical protein